MGNHTPNEQTEIAEQLSACYTSLNLFHSFLKPQGFRHAENWDGQQRITLNEPPVAYHDFGNFMRTLRQAVTPSRAMTEDNKFAILRDAHHYLSLIENDMRESNSLDNRLSPADCGFVHYPIKKALQQTSALLKRLTPTPLASAATSRSTVEIPEQHSLSA